MKSSKLAFVILVLAVVASAQSHNISGKWKTTWTPAGGKPNTITLTEGAGNKIVSLSGTFIADSGEKCAVTGTKSNEANRQIDMKVKCADWSISMTGTIADDGQSIEGQYTAHYSSGPSLGDYRMDKIICMLPEGCN